MKHKPYKKWSSSKVFQSLDMYGQSPVFEFSIEDSTLKTSIGSVMTILTATLVSIYCSFSLRGIYQRIDKSYIVSTYDYNLTDIGQIGLNEYQSEFLYVFSVYNEIYEDFNISNNPYIRVHTNREISGWVVEEDTSTKLYHCSRDDLLQIFTESEVETYLNSMCIDKQSSNMQLLANYDNYEEYKVPYLTIVECKNTTEITCATPQEIEDFVRTS